MTEDQISHRIIGTALEVHSHFGPGLFESTYERALAYDLSESGLVVKTQICIPYQYKKMFIENAFRVDILVNDLVLVEIKSVESLDSTHFAQTLTYLRLSGVKLGLLINFNKKSLRDGIHRVVNNL
jgi:GxxExxY protein